MPQLNCKQCQSRKLKCDKQKPCSACKKAGIRCDIVQRARLPRGRSGKKNHTTDSALKPRIARLEALIHHFNPVSPADTGVNNGMLDVHADMAPSTPRTARFGEFVASEFWTALSQEVSGLRQTLEDSDDDGHDDNTRNAQFKPGGYGDDGCLLLSASDQMHMTASHAEPDARVRETLLEIYEARVNTVFKPVHWPVVCHDIRARHVSTATSAASPSSEALEYSVYYLAVCSLSELECLDLFNDAKDKCLRSYRSAAVTHISRARTLQNPDMQGLQAFVIYLQALRTCHNHALNWTLLAVAVRLATALGLGANDPTPGSPLIVDARRRLWFSICLMDTQATLDRGAAPLIHAKDLGTPPLDVNDNVPEQTTTPIPYGTALTDMSFCTMTYEAMACFKRICAVNEVDGGDSRLIWARKVELVAELEEAFSSKYLSINLNEAAPIEKLLKMGASSIAASMRLLLRRPPYRQKNHVVPPTDEFDSMAGATDVLRRHMELDAHQLAAWAWKKWTPWYALAVALAELCRNTHGDAADRTYAFVREAYRRYALPVTDPDQGMLWRPIARLFRHVTKLKMGVSPGASVPLQTSREITLPDHTSSIECFIPSEQTAPFLGSSPPSHGAGELPARVDVDTEFTFEDILQLSPENNAPETDPSDLEMLDLDFDHGVSWLDWDLIFQDADTG